MSHLARRARGALAALVALIVLAAAPAASASGAPPENWVGTWAASAQPNSQTVLTDQTVRNVVRTSAGGRAVSIRVTNAFGGKPAPPGEAYGDAYTLHLGKVSVAIAQPGSAAVRGQSLPVTFDGERSIDVPPGGEAWSDPVPLRLAPQADLAVSLYVAGTSPNATFHSDTHQTSYLSAGDHADDPAATAFTTPTQHWFFLDAIAVRAARGIGAVATLGDSITDGFGSTLDANRRWPDFLARRLARRGGPVQGVLNEGIDGNEILRDFDCCGGNPNAQSRLDRDVLAQDGVRDLILLQGINDIGHHGTEVTAPQIIQGMKHLIARAHRKGLRIIGGTLTPFEATPIAGFYDPAKEPTRQAVNAFVRSPRSGFDGFVDFDRAIRDPDHPLRLLPAYDSGDHLHPSDAGYRAMAAAVDLRLLR
jgi:lysophospholipase L1-like esterase